MRIIFATLKIVLLGLSLQAGNHYKATTVTRDGSTGNTNKMVVKAWVDGEKAKIEFVESNNPMAGAGTYLVTTDGGQTIFLVNPREKTYTEWDLDQIIQLAGGVLNSLKGIVDLDFSDTEVKLLEEKKGPDIHGMNTTYYKYQTKYDLQVKMLGMKRVQGVETTQELWLTQDVKDLALGVWLRNEPPATGNEELDKLIASEMSKVRGFTLKSVTETINRSYNKKRTKVKKETVTTSEMAVDEWKETLVPKTAFVIPDDYEKVDMMNSTSEEEGGIFKNIFNKNHP